MADAAYAYTPDYAVPPGETLLETIESLGISQLELAERTGRPKKTINEIINGKAAITPETAIQLEQVLSIPASFWNSLEQNYRAALARKAERERLESQIGWVRKFPVKEMVKYGWIADSPNQVSQVKAMLSYFGVASPDAWKVVCNDWRTAAAFRHSAAFETDFATAAAWLRKGELDARNVQCDRFDAARFKAVLHEVRPLTREGPDVFKDALVKRCASAGVAVCVVRELPKLRVCGATRWLTADKALIQLTLRYKTDDQLWFTFFHEAGHILLHGKRSVFVEKRDASSDDMIKNSTREQEEEEANRFASDVLIPPDQYRRLLAAQDFSESTITAFARELNIAPSIVVGRLQHDHVILYSRLNHLKVRLDWAN